MNRRLRAYLRKHGAGHEEIAEAEREGRLALLAFDRTLMPGRPRYRFDDLVQQAGVDRANAQRLWRALGFPDPPPDARRFSDEDVEALKALRDVFRAQGLVGHHEAPGQPSVDRLIQQVRVIGAALARVAEVQSDSMLAAFEQARDSGLSDEQVAELVPVSLEWERISQLLDYTMRLQLRAALWRKYAGAVPGAAGESQATVGFVDLVGYTALSQELEEEELSGLVSRFEEIAYDTVAEHGARVVKMIGDEVMFISEDGAAAARIALKLTERSAVDDALPDARAGLACGPVVAHEGDYYGPVVNLASRIVELARPGSVLASEDVQRALADDPAFGFQRLRSRKIRDIGRVEIWLLESGRELEKPAKEEEEAAS